MWSRSDASRRLRALLRRIGGTLGWHRRVEVQRAEVPEPGQPSLTAPSEVAPPPGFDWRWYVRAYTDLAPAGITDEASAIRHWREHGCREGRRCAPRRPNSFDWLSYVDRFEEARAPRSSDSRGRARLACPSIDSIFLRAWGDLVCWDDAGSDHVLQRWDPAVDYAREFLDGAYQHVRTSLGDGVMPRPTLCSRCLLLRVRPDDAGEPWDRRFVRMLRVEPSYYCTLDCPGCVPLDVRRGHNLGFQLDPEILDRILGDLVAAGLRLDVLDFQGHGEPLLNPRLWEMVRRSRARLPECWISITTNAQGRFRSEITGSGVDEIVCSIDGVDQSTYEPYRVHGDFDLAWRFMCDLARAGQTGERPLRVVWKYVLFEHNSSRDALLRAQQMALDAAVAELVFVITRNGPTNVEICTPLNIPRLQNAPPMSFRFHEPSIEDLEARVAEGYRLVEAGERSNAAVIAESVRQNLARFFGSDGGPQRIQALRESITNLPSL